MRSGFIFTAVLALLVPLPGLAADVAIRHLLPADLRMVEQGKSLKLIEVALPERTVQLELSAQSRLRDSLPADLRERLDRRGFQLFEGRPAGGKPGWARFSRDGQRWQGAWFDGKELYLLDPSPTMKALGRVPRGSRHVAYRLSDLLIDGLHDDSVHAPRSLGDWMRSLGGQDLGKGLLRRLELTVVTDTEFTTKHGERRDTVILGLMNIVDGIYQGQLNVEITVGHVRHLADNGTLTMIAPTGPSGLLETFRRYMYTGAGQRIPKGGLSHLFSGKNFDGSTAGVAFLDVLCREDYGYGINQVDTDTATRAIIIAHELGHNFGAEHDGQADGSCPEETDPWLMSPRISASQNQFSPCSIGVIQESMQGASCLRIAPSGGGYFADSFE